MKTLQVISHLMSYPGDALYQGLPELAEVLRTENALPVESLRGLQNFIEWAGAMPLEEWQEQYVSLFDRGRQLSLHLFEHVHGESRDRGQAMVDLIDHYRSRGYELDAHELPDYIPLFLEYLSTQEPEEISAMLADAMPVLVLLGARLQERDSEYAVLFVALERLGGSCDEAAQMRHQAANEGPDDTLEKMDEIWEEEQVTFMANNDPSQGGGCSANSSPVASPSEVPVRWVEQPSRSAAPQR